MVVLAPTQFAKVLEQLDYSVVGNSDSVVTGIIPQLYGFKGFVCSSNLSGCVGAIIAADAIGIASRYLAPDEGAYSQAWSATDDENGFTLGFRVYTDPATGSGKYSTNCILGARSLQPNKIVRLV